MVEIHTKKNIASPMTTLSIHPYIHPYALGGVVGEAQPVERGLGEIRPQEEGGCLCGVACCAWA